MISASDRATWLVFGDDWGRHPSTTQHLVAHLPPTDRVVWVGSLGMRTPGLTRADATRVWGRLRRAFGQHGDDIGAVAGRRPDVVVTPWVIPNHLNRAAISLNRAVLAATLGRQLESGAGPLLALVANPAAVHYLDAFRPDAVIYLRLDAFAALPGVDPALVDAVEPAMMARADLVVAPNMALLPDAVDARATMLLPQGVDLDAFGAVPPEPPATRVVGYWGALASWLDVELVDSVARLRRDFTFEFRGPRVRTGDDAGSPFEHLIAHPNIRVLPPVPHDRLAAAAAHWRGAWAPFKAGDHLLHASPLKLREYLASGLPTATTVPFPELPPDLVSVTPDAPAVARWLDTVVMHDDADNRALRRNSQRNQRWSDRAEALRARILGMRSESRGT